MLSWDPPLPEHQNGPIGLYHITTTSTDTDEELHNTSTETWAVIGPLHPFYTYKFSVAAETVDVGPFTTPVVLQMPEAGIIQFMFQVIYSELHILSICSSIWNCGKCNSNG